MYCNNCGKIAEEGSVFCTGCGKKLEAAPVVTEAEQLAAEEAVDTAMEIKEKAQEIAAEVSGIAEEPSVVQAKNEASPAESFNRSYSSYTPPANSGIYTKAEPSVPFVPDVNSGVKEKVDFGKGALAFCLVIIGLLAISTGVFAGLYFSLV